MHHLFILNRPHEQYIDFDERHIYISTSVKWTWLLWILRYSQSVVMLICGEHNIVLTRMLMVDLAILAGLFQSPNITVMGIYNSTLNSLLSLTPLKLSYH
jgi:hypothetical protein